MHSIWHRPCTVLIHDNNKGGVETRQIHRNDSKVKKLSQGLESLAPDFSSKKLGRERKRAALAKQPMDEWKKIMIDKGT